MLTVGVVWCPGELRWVLVVVEDVSGTGGSERERELGWGAAMVIDGVRTEVRPRRVSDDPGERSSGRA
jgi:hypothetical protein